jgi:hypothetical protein
MKKIFAAFIALCLLTGLRAQKVHEINLMPALQTDDAEIAEYGKAYLLDKVKDEINRVGYAGVNTSRFIVLVRPTVLDKQSTGQSILYTYNLNFSVVDLLADKTYSGFSIRTGGVGRSGGQAIQDALRKLDLKKSQLASNLKASVEDIVRYYNSNCSQIVAKTNVLLNSRQYDAALANLAFIPDLDNLSCRGEYNAALTKAFDQYAAYRCESAVTEARKQWSLNPNAGGVSAVASALDNVFISPNCKPGFNALVSEIKEKLTRDEFNENEFRKKIVDAGIALERDRIAASRDIAVEYYRNSMPSIYLIR